MPPLTGNWCHCVTPTGRRRKSSISLSNRLRRSRESLRDSALHPCASTTHSIPLIVQRDNYCCACPHSGQNLLVRGIGLPQLMQNFVSALVPVPAGAAGSPPLVVRACFIASII